jgi:two-component system sensor histidine kinase HydH
MIVSSLAMIRDAEPRRREDLRDIAMAEAKRLESLTSDFLSYARPRKLDRRPTSVRETLEYVVGLVGAKAAEMTIALSIDCKPDWTVHVDPFQIHQVLLNLVTNSLDAAPKGGRILLGAGRPEDGGIELFVENTGPPLPAEIVPKLFEPFFTTKPRGTGLGLAIAQGIAHAHGADLVLKSNEPGKVRFSLRLPADSGEALSERERTWRAS